MFASTILPCRVSQYSHACMDPSACRRQGSGCLQEGVGRTVRLRPAVNCKPSLQSLKASFPLAGKPEPFGNAQTGRGPFGNAGVEFLLSPCLKRKIASVGGSEETVFQAGLALAQSGALLAWESSGQIADWMVEVEQSLSPAGCLSLSGTEMHVTSSRPRRCSAPISR